MRTKSNKGFTLIELLIVVAIIGIIAAIAIPGLMRARMSGNESSALGSLRSINSAQSTYAASCANGGYTQNLGDLAKPPAGSNAAFISPDLDPSLGAGGGATILKSGYNVFLLAAQGAVLVTNAAATCNLATANAMSAYYSHAEPLTLGSTGQRSFATDTRGALFQQTTGVQIPDPPTVGGTVTAAQ